MKYVRFNPDTDEELEILTVEYRITAEDPASTSGHPDSWHDGSAAELEFDSILNEAGEDIFNTIEPEELDEIERLCWAEAEAIAEEYNDYY